MMPQPVGRAKVTGLQERPFGSTVLRVFVTAVDLDALHPNPRQPRRGEKKDEEFERQIEANEGIFTPLLVEPHPEIQDEYQIIDGERRWRNSKALVEKGKEVFRRIPVEVTDRTLTDEERLRVWIFIHRQRKEWNTREKEMVAFSLVNFVGRASAANMLGMTVREVDKLVEVFEVSERFNNLTEPGAAVTWARELLGVSKNLLTPTVMDAIVEKVNQKRITNSKDLRKLRLILRDPEAKAHFLKKEGDFDSALLRIRTEAAPIEPALVTRLGAAVDAMRNVPWATLEELRGDPTLLAQIEEAERLLTSLRGVLSR